MKLSTTTSSVTIHPPKTALVIVDMQNFFLSAALGRKQDSEGYKAEKALLEYGIPAARKAGIQIVWLTWGIRDEDLEGMLRTMLRIFRFRITHGDDGSLAEPASVGEEDRITTGGIGCSIGNVTLEDGSAVDGGRLLMRDTWNTRLHPPLEAEFNKSLTLAVPDVQFHKDRLSGMWGASTPLTEYLKKRGFTTLLFTGVNTDQCVLATMQDAVFKGWDCLLLKDGCGTNSPDFARRATEFNGEQSWGFVSTCKELKEGVDTIVPGP
jgi:nicotinamidase-related amidase